MSAIVVAMSTTLLVSLIVAGALAVAGLSAYITSWRLIAPLLAAAVAGGLVAPYGLWAVIVLAASLALGLPVLGYLAYRLHRARRLAAVWQSLVEAFHSRGSGSDA